MSSIRFYRYAAVSLCLFTCLVVYYARRKQSRTRIEFRTTSGMDLALNGQQEISAKGEAAILTPPRSRHSSAWNGIPFFLYSNQRYLAGAVFTFLLAWTAFNWFQTVQAIIHFYTPIPTWDYWRIPQDMARYPVMGLRTLWIQHNEHRILSQEIVFLCDMLFCRGCLILPLVASILCYFASWILLAHTVLSDRYVSPAIQAIAILLAGIVIGWRGTAVALASPFLLQWSLMAIGALASLACVAKLTYTRGNNYLVIAIIAGAIATYASANALLLWPVLLLAGATLRLTRGRMLALALSAIFFVGIYFIGYNFTGTLHIKAFFLHPIYTAKFVGSYFSMPFGALGPPGFGAYLGLSSLTVVIALGVIALRKRLLATEAAVVLFGWYLFTLFSALLTAAGRMTPTDSAFVLAKQPRYVLVPLLTWAVFVLLCMWMSNRCKSKALSPVTLTAVFIALLFIGFLKLQHWTDESQPQYSDAQLVALSVENRLVDPMLIRKIFPQAEFVVPLLDYLREHDLSVFTDKHAQWLGRPASQFSATLSGMASGEVSYVLPVRSGLEVIGWVDESDKTHPAQWVMFTNEKQQIAGFGRKLAAGFPVYFRSPDTPPSMAWVGFVNFKVPAKTYSAYVIDNAGLVAITGTFSAPPIASTSATDHGPAIPGVAWDPGRSWKLNGVPPGLTYWYLPANRIYGNWSQTRSGTDRITSSIFSNPTKGCFVLPVLHGPLLNGQSVEVRDGDTGEVFERVPMYSGDLQWEFWRVSVPASIQHLQITAESQGESQDQWLAIADPTECR